jgi:general secretion pathway protein F
MRFEIRAYVGGRITSLRVDATNREDALRQANAQALRPIDVRELGQGAWWEWRDSGSRFETLLFVQELLALLEAGLSIIEAIETLQMREKQKSARNILARLARGLREGKSFANALESIPEVFPNLFVGIVRSSERTGDLPSALGRFIDYRRRSNGLRTKVINAAIYPLVLIVVAVGVILFLGGYVVPRFAAVYKGSGRSLPWASQLLLE